MRKNNVLVSIFSNWAALVLSVIIAFIVSPLLVNTLGDETYGIWVIIVSITGYFTVLDFGVNTAIVRYISKYTALKDAKNAIAVYSSSFSFFSIVALFVVTATAIFAFFFKEIFEIQSFTREYLYIVFFIVGLDLALNLTFSVLMGTLRGLQRFFELNAISMGVLIIKNALLVYLLYEGHSLMTLAALQVGASIVRFILQYIVIRRSCGYLRFKANTVNRSTLKSLYNYSIYSFLIAIAAKILFFTDSIVIGSFINVSQVTYYAIPAMIMEYMEKFIWAIVGVLLPIISSQDAVGDTSKNKQLYLTGTKYSVLLIAPVVVVLYIVGDDFIGLWMGKNYAQPSGDVLLILLLGYTFFLAQLIAHGILKGISRHKMLAYFLCGEALVNLGLSVWLAPQYGIKGVAIGTAIPLIIANLVILPMYTCSVLNIKYSHYLWQSIIKPLILPVALLLFYLEIKIEVSSYLELLIFSGLTALLLGLIAVLFMLDKEHKTKLLNALSKR